MSDHHTKRTEQYFYLYPEFNDDTYDCPGDILNSRSEARASPIPVFYALDESYPDSISNTFHRDSTFRGRPDGRVYDEPEGDLRRSPYIVMDNQRGSDPFTQSQTYNCLNDPRLREHTWDYDKFHMNGLRGVEIMDIIE